MFLLFGGKGVTGLGGVGGISSSGLNPASLKALLDPGLADFPIFFSELRANRRDDASGERDSELEDG